jgi:hypothetical protein
VFYVGKKNPSIKMLVGFRVRGYMVNPTPLLISSAKSF